MKIKVSKHKLNIHYRGSPWGSRTHQHAYCLHYAPSQHIESHLGKKQLQAKIPVVFLFNQPHFNNVTSHALFYDAHLVMCSAKAGNHLKGLTKSSSKRSMKWLQVIKIWELITQGTSWSSSSFWAPIDGQHFINPNSENALNISSSQQKHELDKNVSPFAEAPVHYWDLNFVINLQSKT